MSNLLEVKNLKTYFYLSSGIVRAVDGVSFSLEKGKTMGIVGESGSGKSVTASSIIRLIPQPIGKIVEGEIIFDGKDILKMNQKELRSIRGKDISMIFQDPMTSLDPVYKIGDQMIEIILTHQNITKAEAKQLAIKTLENVGIVDAVERFNSYPHQFSGGMRQRVMIAMALVSDLKLIIADEPTTALDVTVQAKVLDLLKEVQKNTEASILLITHNLGVVWDMCDTVMVMYAGKTVEYASVHDLYKNPLHPYTWGLLDSMPRLSQNSEKPLTTIEGSPPDLRLTGEFCNFHYRCPYAKDICRTKKPELIEVNKNHLVSCHFQTSDLTLQRKEL